MKKIAIIIILFVVTSCSKTYLLMNDEKVQKKTADEKNLEKLNLGKYIFYKREIYFYVDAETGVFYKGPDSIFNGNKCTRYEMQFMAIEDKLTPNIIYFSYSPPYKTHKNYIFNRIPYNKSDLVNLNDINYIQFGKLNGNEIKFIRDKTVSLWTISIQNDKVEIDSVVFLDRGKMKNVKTYDYLHNRAVFVKVNNPNILLHYYHGENISDCKGIDSSDCITDYLEEKILHYDVKKHNIYFEFNASLLGKNNPIRTWIRYSHKRVKAKYSKE